MTVSLNSNFFLNARGVTFEDANGVAWSFNSNTNQLTASVSGASGGTVTSVGLADGSTTALYTITGTPVTTTGTLTFSLKTQSANAVLAGPTTGSAAQPTFRGLVVADLPSGYAYSNLSGAPSIPSAANPSASIGLTVTNGSASTYMRSDAAPALSQSIAPTWTGLHSFSPSGSNSAISVGGNANATAVLISAGSGQYGLQLTGNGSAFAQKIIAGSGAAGLYIANTPGAGTAALRVDTAATTGSKTASMSASNKPGTNNQTTPSVWLPINCDGTLYYFPGYAA